MKNLIVFVTLLFCTATFAQKNSDTAFERRLNDYMRFTRELQFDDIINYTHPKLFTIATKDQLKEFLQGSFENEQMKIEFDSTAIKKVSENFKVENVLYKRVDYWMAVTVSFKNTAALSDTSFINSMTAALQQGFPEGKIVYNPFRKKFEIQSNGLMIAIKDNDSAPWMFLGYQKNDALIKKLYPQQVIDHFKLL